MRRLTELGEDGRHRQKASGSTTAVIPSKSPVSLGNGGRLRRRTKRGYIN